MKRSHDFHVEYCIDRPWATVWDPWGFREPGCETFLTFWAWQDLSARRIHRQAQHLTDAWNYLRAVDLHWSTARWLDWEELASTMMCQGTTLRRLTAQADTLYRFYAFWHWYDPKQLPRQYWPSMSQARIRWLHQIWGVDDSLSTELL